MNIWLRKLNAAGMLKMDKAGTDGADGGGGGSTDGDGTDGGNETVTMSQADFKAEIARQVSEAMKGQKDPFQERDERVNDQREQSQHADQERKQVQNAASFNATFDSFIKDNKQYFPDSVNTARVDAEAESDDLLDRTRLMAGFAARDFFKVPENLNSLSGPDQARVKSEILEIRFSNKIDGDRVWELVERAIFNLNLAGKNDFSQRSTGNDGATGYENFDKYVAGFFPEHVKAVN